MREVYAQHEKLKSLRAACRDPIQVLLAMSTNKGSALSPASVL